MAEPVAMYFRNPYLEEFEECPDGVLDVYHMRNHNEGVNSYMKDNLSSVAYPDIRRVKKSY